MTPERLFVLGFPGLYGGAGTELHHQIIAWRHMDLEVHLIPTWPAGNEPLYPEMIERGVTVHPPRNFDAVQPGDPVLGFCNAEFLEALPAIREKTSRTVFANCMTWLFDKEQEAMTKGLISMFLYQNEGITSIRSSTQVRSTTISTSPTGAPGTQAAFLVAPKAANPG